MTVIRLKVHVKSKKESIKKMKEKDRYEVWIKEPARNNLANKRLRELIVEVTGYPLEQVNLIKGKKSRFKTFAIGND